MSTNKSSEKFHLNFETVGSIVAIVVGVAALFIAWDQARVMRAQQHAVVWPVLTIDKNYETVDSNLVFKFVVKNAGIGPALLKYATLDNERGRLNSWENLSESIFEQIRISDGSIGSTIRGRVLSPADLFSPYGLVWKDDVDLALISQGLQELLANTSLSICYCSVFDRCWIASSNEAASIQQVNTCQMDDSGVP